MTTYDLVVIGSGPGGYTAASRAGKLGLSVACVEQEERLGGVCLNVGCIPSKALLDSSELFHQAKTRFPDHGIDIDPPHLDLPRLMARKDAVVESLTKNVRDLLEESKVRVIHGTARLQGKGIVAVSGKTSETLEAKAVLLATGSAPIPLLGLPFDGTHIITSTEALSLAKVPEHLIVVGGGYIGLELGSVWLRLGARVTVLEMMPRIAGPVDSQVARALQRSLEKQGMLFKLGTKVLSAEVSGGLVTVSVETDGKRESISGDMVLTAVGRRPNTRNLGLETLGIVTDPKTGHIRVDGRSQTSVPGIYAIGDLIPGPALAHKASAEGIAVAEVLSGHPGLVNYETLPSVIYTFPEAAAVGLTEDQAKAQGLKVCTGVFPFAGNGRARCMGETEGFAKLISDAKTDRLLGAHIIGPRASDMIAECVLAMEFGGSAEDIARTVHGHPTFSEALQEAAQAATRCARGTNQP